jgi:hypothetical protein
MQRYESTVDLIKHNEVGKRRYETMLYPDFKPSLTDQYIISKRLDRMDLIAKDWYGDPRLWWVIQRANQLPGGTLVIPAGTRIRIPFPLPPLKVREELADKQF